MTVLATKLTCVHPENDGKKKPVEREMMLVEDDMCYTFECPQCHRQVNLYAFSYYVEKKGSEDLEPKKQ